MLINNTNQPEKNINKEGIIYALIFVIYIIILVLVFGSAIKFLRTNINTALNTPDNTEVENKYGQLDLESYSLLANKLSLVKNTQISTTTASSTEMVASSTPEIATTTIDFIATSTLIINTSTEITSNIAPVVENRPTIAVVNSTIKSGLAANLKNKLTTAGYKVISTGNTKPALAITTIRVKSIINADSKYLAEIKKIVSTDYDFVILDLDDQAKSDIEVIIGNK